MEYTTPFELSSKLLHSIEQIGHGLVHPIRGRDEDLKVICRLERDIHLSLHALRKLHNALLPISQLPPEILGFIFELTQDDYAGKIISTKWRSRNTEELDPFQDVFQLAHVSQYFRSVAIANPSLWSTLVFHDQCPHLNFYKLYIQRSRNLPLNLYFNSSLVDENEGASDSNSGSSYYCDYHGSATFSDIIQMVAPRIRSLIMDEMPQSPVEVLTSGKFGSMPLLESVLIPQDAGDFACIFEKSSPRMVGITEATQWNWPGGAWYQHLTVFTFHASEDWEAHDVINAHDIVQFLSNTLQLQVLDLRGIRTTGRLNTNRPITQVALIKLRYIYLRLCTQEIIDLVIDYFSLAPNFEVYIGHDFQRGRNNRRDDFQFIDNRLPHSSFLDEPVVDLIVHCYSVYKFYVTFTTRRGSIVVDFHYIPFKIVKFQKIIPGHIQNLHLELPIYVPIREDRDPYQFLGQIDSLSSISIFTEQLDDTFPLDKPFQVSEMPGFNSILVVEESRSPTGEQGEPTGNNIKVRSPNLSTLTLYSTSSFKGAEDIDGRYKPIFDLLEKRFEAGCLLEKLVVVCPDKPGTRYGVFEERVVPGVKAIEVVKDVEQVCSRLIRPSRV